MLQKECKPYFYSEKALLLLRFQLDQAGMPVQLCLSKNNRNSYFCYFYTGTKLQEV